MNTFSNVLNELGNYKYTENGALALSSTGSKVMDLFGLGAAYRKRDISDCILLFKEAFEEQRDLALKCLFYIGDCRGGQGERRFFRICFRWLAENYSSIAKKNIENIPEFRRWDDLIYSCLNTPIEADMMKLIKMQILLDAQSKTPSLLAKWMPSENASSRDTRVTANRLRTFLGMTHKQYRTTLSVLRGRIKIVETLMSQNRWDEIEFDKLPSKAGIVYRNAFARRDIIKAKYEAFAKDKTTKVNAATLYPYEVIDKALKCNRMLFDESERLMVNKYWENLPDYFEGKPSNMLCVVDTSASMRGYEASSPINVAISLGMYAAERARGPFKDTYISFSSEPRIVKVQGIDISDKAMRIYRTNLCENTNLYAVFKLLLTIADRPDVREEDIPSQIVVISDMEIDYQTTNTMSEGDTQLMMQKVRQAFAEHGHKVPKLIYWNVDARQNTFIDKGPGVSFVSGCSPTIFKQVITGKTGFELMLETICAERYSVITV